MDEVLKVIGIVGAAWLLLSILLAVAWTLGGKRIFRKPPAPPSEATQYATSMQRYRENRRGGEQ